MDTTDNQDLSEIIARRVFNQEAMVNTANSTLIVPEPSIKYLNPEGRTFVYTFWQ